MRLRNKKLLIIDTETSGLPMSRPKVPKHKKYPNPRFHIAYKGARLLSLAFLSTDLNDGLSSFLERGSYPIEIIRNNADLAKCDYQTNQSKYPDKAGKPITEILDILKPLLENCDIVVGHNVMFDINIIAHEAYLIGHPVYNILMNKLEAEEYFCTLDAAARMGIDARDLTLQKFYDFMNDGYSYIDQKLTFHTALDDVKATKLIVERLINDSFSIPPEILAIIDEIYEPTIDSPLRNPKLDPYGKVDNQSPDPDKKDNFIILRIYLTDFAYDYYKAILPYSYSSFNAVGLAIFHIDSSFLHSEGSLSSKENSPENVELISNSKFSAKDGTYTIRFAGRPETEEIRLCRYIFQDAIFTCSAPVNSNKRIVRTGNFPAQTDKGVCNKSVLGYEICDDCADSTAVFEAYEQMMKIPFNQFSVYTTADVKALLPKDKPRRSGTIALEVRKSGRSNTVSADIVDFYIEHEIYNYFSLTIGSVKL